GAEAAAAAVGKHDLERRRRLRQAVQDTLDEARPTVLGPRRHFGGGRRSGGGTVRPPPLSPGGTKKGLLPIRSKAIVKFNFVGVPFKDYIRSRAIASIGTLRFMIPKIASAKPRPTALARAPSGTRAPSGKGRVLVVCTHLRPGRIKRRSTYVMQ